MTEPDPLPQTAFIPALRAFSKNLLLPLLLLELFCCASAVFDPAGSNEQRPGAVAGPPNSFGEPDDFWSSDGVLFHKGTLDLERHEIGDETAIAEAREFHGSQSREDHGTQAREFPGSFSREFHGSQSREDHATQAREFHGVQEAEDSTKYGTVKVWQPSAKHLQNYNPRNQFTIPQNFDHHADKGESVRTAMNEEFTSPRTVKIQTGQEPQGNCAQEAPECKRVSSQDKSNEKMKEIRLEYPVMTRDQKMRSSKGAMQSRSEREVDPNTNQKDDEDKRQALLLGESENDPKDNIKRGRLPSLNLPPDAQDAAHRGDALFHGFHEDGEHAEHSSASTSGLYTSGGSRNEFTGSSTSEIYIPSASPVAAPPRNGHWHSLLDAISGGSPFVDGTEQMPSESWSSGGLDAMGAVSPNLTSEWGCWDTNAPSPEIECRGRGFLVKQVPTDLHPNVSRITLMDVGMEILRNDSFTQYRSTLKEIVLENARLLRTIEAGAFNGLYQLRSIYIHSAPLLRNMPNLTFSDESTSLRSIRITNSGLERIPVMQFTGTEDIVHIIELDNNRIKKVHRRSLKVRVEQLSLNFNLIECVEKEAFDGSKIGKLSLKGNIQLRSLHPEAFQGIGSLRTLDLSETSITSLPTLGLTDLEILLLEKTPSLKIFPSVYSFKTIKKAHLTYPYHCCAFQFPEQHDPEQYIRHQEFLRKMERDHCSEVTSPNPPLTTQRTRLRRRRHHEPPGESQGPWDGSAPAQTIPAGRSGERQPRERWGTVRSTVNGGAIRLSSVTSRGKNIEMMKSGNDGVSQPSLADSSLGVKNFASARQHRKYNGQRSAPSFVSKEGLAFPRTRHNGHHSRHARSKLGPNIDLESKKTFQTTHNLGDHKSRSRRGDRSRIDAPVAGRSWSNDEDNYSLLYPTSEQQHPGRAAALRNPKKDLIPLPEKRFESGEANNRRHDEHNDGFIGGGAVGGFPSSFLGFGAFNHTSQIYLPAHRNGDTSTGWGEDQGWPGHPPPLDSGDDRTYSSGSFDVHEVSHGLGFPEDDEIALFPPVGFPDDGGFPDDIAGGAVGGRGENERDRSTSLHQTEIQWHGSQAPVNSTMIVVLCGNLSKDYHKVLCVPKPDAFNPCEDIMGNLALRVAVWLVVVTAVVGNLAVMVVLISSKFKMTVSKFLMVNLALADLCMGLYLLIIATMDLHTIGVYFNHAIDWQNGPGCKVAGFLTVFASELSIFTLTVITSERWYAITYAIHLNKRLKLSMAIKVMVMGWAYSITMAALPLVGVSNYSKTSICLPMETGDALALTYLIALLLVNGLAFFVITACYTSMYCSISRHDATAPNSDLTVAKRMALLVFTDFACWAPIAFFGLTAVAGLPLINVTRAKILLVFFYPLNSCANPYLYAILTKQYRRDLFILLARYGFCTKRAMRYKGAYSSVNNTFPHNTLVNAPNHRNSTLTQITLCDLTRTARTSQQSNNGSLLGTMVEGSQDSLQKNVSPIRTPTKPEMVSGENERLSTVQEMSHSIHSDDDNSDDLPHSDERASHDSQSGCVVKQAGSPHPIKNCYTRLSFTPEQEEILKQALHESKARKKIKSDGDRYSQATQELLADKGRPTIENGKSLRHGEVIVICEVEVGQAGQSRSVSDHGDLDKADEATSTV